MGKKQTGIVWLARGEEILALGPRSKGVVGEKLGIKRRRLPTQVLLLNAVPGLGQSVPRVREQRKIF